MTTLLVVASALLLAVLGCAALALATVERHAG
jgi:hypothetical protein